MKTGLISDILLLVTQFTTDSTNTTGFRRNRLLILLVNLDFHERISVAIPASTFRFVRKKNGGKKRTKTTRRDYLKYYKKNICKIT